MFAAMRHLILLMFLLGGMPAFGFTAKSGGQLAERMVPIIRAVPVPMGEITDEAGRGLSLDRFAGEVSIVTLWATWCHVCEGELPKLNELARALNDSRIRVRPITIDQDTVPTAAIRRYMDDHGLDALPILRDLQFAVWRKVGARGTPTTIFVDKFSQVVAAIVGGGVDWQDDELMAWLRALADAETATQSRQLLTSLTK